MKKAYLVNFDLITRVIAENEEKAILVAIDKIKKDIKSYVCQENAVEVKEDKEIPYSDDEKEKSY